MNAVAAPSKVDERQTERVAPGRQWWQRPLVIGLALFVLYVGFARFTDPGGYLSTDTGGKVASVDAMAERGDLDPNIGYWASDLDPDGSLFPMYGTTAYEDDRWVNATTLPMLYAALPLYQLAGYDGALVIPMLGAVFSALAAGALVRRLRPGSDGVLATWIVGAASPAVIYALDFWEHSIGLALMAWAVVAVMDVVDLADGDSASTTRQLGLSLGAGAAFGAASTMRQEALVYGFVAGLVLVGSLLVLRSIAPAIRNGAAMVAGTVILVAANAVLELVVLGNSSRTGRSAGTATAFGSDIGVRLEEALITGATPFGVGRPIGVLAAVGLIVGLVLLARSVLEGGNPRIGGAIVGAVYLLTALDFLQSGLSFVPGMLATLPLAGAGLVVGVRSMAEGTTARIPFLVATVSLPLVWAVQFTGGAGPQWGGRYILTSGLILAAIAIAGLEQRGPQLVRGLAAVGLAVTLIGVAWTAERTSGFASATAEIAMADEPILVWADPFLSREAGPLAVEGQWLAAWTDDLRAEAALLVIETGEVEFGYVAQEFADPVTFEGFEAAGERLVPLIDGFSLRVTTYVRT